VPNTIKNNIFAYGRLGTKQEGCDPPAAGVLQFTFTNNLIYFDMGYVQTGYAYCMGGSCTEVQKYSDNMYCYAKGVACALPTTRSTLPVRLADRSLRITRVSRHGRVARARIREA